MSTGTVGATRPAAALRWRRSARRLTDGQAEQLVAAHRAVMALGDDRSYVVAILTLDGEIAPLVAAKMGIEFTDLADLSSKPEIRSESWTFIWQP